MDVCTNSRDRWLTAGLDPSAVAGDAHLETCEACRAWIARRRDHAVALSGLAPQTAPAELDELVIAAFAPGESSAFEARLRRRLSGLERHRAPDVLERLVAEELADPQAARIRRFVGDVDRPAVPGALTQRLRRTGLARRAGSRAWAWGALASAAALMLVLALGRDGGSAGRPFEVHYGRPENPSPLAAGLAQGWNGGIVGDAVEGGR